MLLRVSAVLLFFVAVLMPRDVYAVPETPVPIASIYPDTAFAESPTIDIDTARLMPRFPGVVTAEVPTLHPASYIDSLCIHDDTYAQRDWLYKLKHKQLQIDDPTVRWPSGFVAWCVGAYNWFQRNFNARDTTYVKSDGKIGKLMLLSDNWADNYLFGSKTLPYITMGSKLFPNLGIYVKYGILSVGYSVDISTLFGGDHSTHQKWNFSVDCAKFRIEAHLWRNSGTTYIHRFEGIKELKHLDLPFDGLTFSAANIHGYYIFDSRKFDFGAALGFSNNQRISRGSAVAGLDVSRIVANFDFTKLPDELNKAQQYPLEKYRFHYQSFCLLGGYSFNWVMSKRFVFNITAIPGVGITYSHEDSSFANTMQLAGVFKGMAALLYTSRRFFVGLRGQYHANACLTDDIDFMNGRLNAQVALGFRF